LDPSAAPVVHSVWCILNAMLLQLINTAYFIEIQPLTDWHQRLLL